VSDDKPGPPLCPRCRERFTELVPLREIEDRHIKAVLAVMDGNVKAAAHILGIGRATLYRRLAKERAAHRRRIDTAIEVLTQEAASSPHLVELLNEPLSPGMLTKKCSLTEEEWVLVFKLRCRSKSGLPPSDDERALLERAFSLDPERYRAMNADVFEATRPFGSSAKPP
jgi:transposase-like protein